MTSPTTSPRPARRTLMRGAAWAAPAVLAGVSAPALAVSSAACTTPEPLTNYAPTFATGLPGYTLVSSSGFLGNGPVLAYASNFGGDTSRPSLSNTNDPQANTEALAVLESTTAVCLAPGTYRVRFDAGYVSRNTRSMYLLMESVDATGVRLTGASAEASTRGKDDPLVPVENNLGYDFELTQNTAMKIRFTISLPFVDGETRNTTSGDDIRFTTPRVTKIA